MIVVRGVFQAKYGKSDELVQLLKEGQATWPSGRNNRILTDLSGQFFTVIVETDFDSFDEWQAMEIFSDERFGPWFERMMLLVESGHREFYQVAG